MKKRLETMQRITKRTFGVIKPSKRKGGVKKPKVKKNLCDEIRSNLSRVK